MDFWTGIVDVIKATAWPATVCIGYYIFKPEIKGLFKRLTRLKYKDAEADFKEGALETMRELVVNKPHTLTGPPEEQKGENLDSLVKLANTSPRIAVLNAWRWFQDNLIEGAERFGCRWEGSGDRGKFQNALAYLARNRRLPAHFFTAIERLTPVVTGVLTNSDFAPSVKDAEEFVLYSAAIVEDLKKLR